MSHPSAVARSLARSLCVAAPLFLAGAHCTGQGGPPPSDVPADGATADGGRPAPPATAWLPDAVGYEIFVRSFADSNSDGNGDLPGLLGRLDYLQRLGVDLLWLTPIHPSPSYHGYDVTDYGAVHPDFGTVADVERLAAEAHRRGMRLFLDLVLNHTSNQHPWFKAAAAGTMASRYIFRGDAPTWMSVGGPVWRQLATPGPGGSRYYLGLFSGVMPDLNLRDADTQQALDDVVGLWLDRGVDGYRLDAARYLVESPDPATAPAQTAPAFADTADTHLFLQSLRRKALGRHPAAGLVGEVWTDFATIGRYQGDGAELHGCFHFPFAGAVIDALSHGSGAPLRSLLDGQAKGAIPTTFFLPFLSNHDQKRIASVIPADSLRLAAALLFSMPGTPFVYYGEELGLPQSAASGDRAQRQPMPWDTATAQESDPGSLWRHYQRLLALRRANPALRSPSLALLYPSVADDRLLIFKRGDASADSVLAIFNVGTTAVSGAVLPLPSDHPLGPQQDLLGAPLPDVTRDNRSRYPLPNLPPRGALFLTPVK